MQFGARPQTLEDFVAVLLRQVEVKQYEVGRWSGGICFGLFDKSYRHFAVRHNVHHKGELLHPHHFTDEQRVGQVVFSHQKIEKWRAGQTDLAWGG